MVVEMYRNKLPSELSMEESPTQSAKMLVHKIGEAPLKKIIAIQFVNHMYSPSYTDPAGDYRAVSQQTFFYICGCLGSCRPTPNVWGIRPDAENLLLGDFGANFPVERIGALFGFGHIS